MKLAVFFTFILMSIFFGVCAYGSGFGGDGYMAFSFTSLCFALYWALKEI
jgi:hypothetical protein